MHSAIDVEEFVEYLDSRIITLRNFILTKFQTGDCFLADKARISELQGIRKRLVGVYLEVDPRLEGVE